MSLGHSPKIVMSGLVVCLDAANPRSYSGSGTTVTDLSGNGNNATINGSVSYVAAGAASYFNWAAQANSDYIYCTNSISYVDITIVFYPDFTLNSQASLVGLISSSTPNTDKSLRFGSANGTGPWTVRNPGNTDDWASTTTTFYLNGSSGATQLVTGWNIFGGYRTNQSNYALSSAYYLGSSGYNSRGFKGRIAACYLYNRQLTAAEQLQNFYALRGRYGI